MTIAVDLGRKATKQTNKCEYFSSQRIANEFVKKSVTNELRIGANIKTCDS